MTDTYAAASHLAEATPQPELLAAFNTVVDARRNIEPAIRHARRLLAEHAARVVDHEEALKTTLDARPELRLPGHTMDRFSGLVDVLSGGAALEHALMELGELCNPDIPVDEVPER